MPEIMQVDKAGSHRTGTLSGVSYDDLVRMFGPPNIDDDPDKVRWSWGVAVDGQFAGVWDWKRSGDYDTWSLYDPHNVIPALFGQ